MTPAVVLKDSVTPRSYLINTPQGAVLPSPADLSSQPAQDTPASADSAGETPQPASVITPETVSFTPGEVTQTPVQTPG